ncbi:hypothetical protein OESDEN_18168 [Oesophagostomum dentatum]|uniref:Uncharacterized protein n=1 Tax=Oesophagostomum dentatum TaxID=61180 RepID=A0A0B1SG59_OESDE|nr:hypothetical protein OESDEN_18168 [Oesophagostomum dentatum]
MALEAQEHKEVEKDDVAIKAEHAAKMAAKWEKLQAKEAKKAERSRMPEKKTTAVAQAKERHIEIAIRIWKETELNVHLHFD